jgi:hypothetical protein
MDDLAKILTVIAGAIAFVCVVVIGVVLLKPPARLHAMMQDQINRKYTLSTHKIIQSGALGITFFCLPFLAVLSGQHSFICYALALWCGILMFLTVIIIYLAASAHYQHFRTPRMNASRASRNSMREQAHLIILHLHYAVAEWRTGRVERKAGKFIRWQAQIQAAVRQATMQSRDPALMNILSRQWLEEYNILANPDLQKRLESVTLKLLKLSQLATDDAKSDALRLEALALRHELINRTLAGLGLSDHKAIFDRRDNLHTLIQERKSSRREFQTVKDTQIAVVRSLKRQRLVLN